MTQDLRVGRSTWADDPAAFETALVAARGRHDRGEQVVPLLPGDVDAPTSSRGFGVELEFDLDRGLARRSAIEAIGEELHRRGFIRRPVQRRYHAGRGDYGHWRLERDSSVHAELISPLLHDEPSSWAEVEAVCEIVRRHGAQATHRAGGHVHVAVGDFDQSFGDHVRLLTLFQAYEDTLYRLSQNPGSAAHRGTRSCAPNPPVTPSCATATGLALRHSGHRLALNFAAATRRTTADHVEFRLWDSTLEPAIVQAHVKLSLGLADAAVRQPPPVAGRRHPLGTRWTQDRMRARLPWRTDDSSRADSRNFRQLVDDVLRGDQDKEQATALFAVTNWQPPP